MEIVVRGRGVVKGYTEGRVVVLPGSFKGNSGMIDLKTGVLLQYDNKQSEIMIKGAILILSGGRGSTGWPTRLHATVLAGIGPRGLVFPRIDARTGGAAAVSQIPVLTDLDLDPFAIFRTGDYAYLDCNMGKLIKM